MAPPPPPPLLRGNLVDDLISEILVRLPPDEPEHLFRAALVCKPWLRIIASAAFQRWYGEFHRVPPLLGFIVNVTPSRDSPPLHRFTPTTARPAFSLLATTNRPPYPHLDCRHGRVLTKLEVAPLLYEYRVWNPVTGVEHRVPGGCILSGYAAVFCAAVGCNHQRCHDGPFRVVEVTLNYGDVFSVMVYLSATGSWSDPVTIKPAQSATPICRLRHRAPVIGNEVFLHILPKIGIVKYNWLENSLSMETPAPPPPSAVTRQLALMEMEDSCLGFASIEDDKLYVWTKVAADWIPYRVIDLLTIPCLHLTRPSYPEVCGFAEGVGKIFISTASGIFMIGMDSEVVRVDKMGYYRWVLPYLSFYTPDTSNAVKQVMLTINATTGLEDMTVEATSHNKGKVKELVRVFEYIAEQHAPAMTRRIAQIDHRASGSSSTHVKAPGLQKEGDKEAPKMMSRDLAR